MRPLSHSLSPSSSRPTIQLVLLHFVTLLPTARAVKACLHTYLEWTHKRGRAVLKLYRTNEITNEVSVPCKPLVVCSFQTSYNSVSIIHKTNIKNIDPAVVIAQRGNPFFSQGIGQLSPDVPYLYLFTESLTSAPWSFLILTTKSPEHVVTPTVMA